ncbi:hypothetical protein RUND412_007868 [Rhizina undulata]
MNSAKSAAQSSGWPQNFRKTTKLTLTYPNPNPIDIACIVYNRADQDQKAQAVAIMRELVQTAAEEGYGEYRKHLLFADQVASTYGWNNQALMRFNETLKDSLDPNEILAPGRAGIWPKRFRGKGWEIMPGDPRTSSTPVNVKSKMQIGLQ